MLYCSTEKHTYYWKQKQKEKNTDLYNYVITYTTDKTDSYMIHGIAEV